MVAWRGDRVLTHMLPAKESWVLRQRKWGLKRLSRHDTYGTWPRCLGNLPEAGTKCLLVFSNLDTAQSKSCKSPAFEKCLSAWSHHWLMKRFSSVYQLHQLVCSRTDEASCNSRGDMAPGSPLSIPRAGSHFSISFTIESNTRNQASKHVSSPTPSVKCRSSIRHIRHSVVGIIARV